ncbi:MAG: hypothetical protein SWQ30_19230 [Thermodesulfobacteriota bacterium]|nr:hypothetical protein [Thermodesulfobacteriota bacterium]
MKRMTTAELAAARTKFRQRIDSLEGDTLRCFWNLREEGAPGCAFFPAVMYCFATIDYFSSFWSGWNHKAPKKKGQKPENQTTRITAFMEKYLLYPSKESQIAIAIWRHKLMHTAEPRILRNADNAEVYLWEVGKGVPNHMVLDPREEPDHFLLRFDPLALCRDLREAVFGPEGYSQHLRGMPDLQDKYLQCLAEMNSYQVKLV